MKLNKPTEEQIKQWEKERTDNDRQLIPGFGKFFVKEAESEISKGGNEQIKLTLSVTDSQQTNKRVWTYLVNTPKMMFKTEHFCKQVKLEKEYESGELEDFMCLNKEGVCVLKMQKSKEYGDKVVISDFPEPDTEFKDDDVNF